MRQFHKWFISDIQPVKIIKESTAKKQVNKRLTANQQAGRYIHVMDDDMFNSVKLMIESEDETNKQMAIDIVLKSRMSKEHIDYFVSKHSQSLYKDKQ